MDQIVVVALINNAALLLVLSAIYELTYLLPSGYRRIQPIANGLLIALFCIATMMTPFTLQQGVIIDTRSIIISVTALIFGPIPTVIAMVAAAMFRISIGGAGTLPGLAIITSSALIGLAWRRWLYPKSAKWRWLNIYAMSIAVHITMLACLLLLPSPDNLTAIGKIAAPVLIIYPVASLLLGLLLMRQQELRHIQKELKQSEERFQLLFNKAPLGYQSLDSDGKFIEVNQQWLDTLGYSKEEVLGKWFGDFLSPAYRDAFRKKFPVFKALGQIHSEFEVLHKEGRQLYISFDGRIGYGLDGNFKQTHCILQDITEQKAAEVALQLSEKKYRRLAENMSDVVWTTDLNLKTTYISQSVERLFGNTVEYHLNQKMADKYPPNALKKIQALLIEQFEIEKDPKCDKNRTILVETEHYRADGSIIWTSMHVSFLRDESGNLVGFQGVTRDITERKKIEGQLMQSYKDLLESQRIAHLGTWRLNLATNQVVWSAELYKMYGFDPNSPPPPYTEHMKLFTPESWSKLSTSIERTTTVGIPYELELETINKDRPNGWMWTRGEAETDSNGNIIAVWGAAQDITERKRAETALQESESRLIAAQKMAHVGNWELNLGTKTIWASEETFNIYGIEQTSQYLSLDVVQEIVLPEYRNLLDQKLEALISKSEKYNAEFEIRKANTGKKIYIHSIAILQTDDNGKPYKIVGTIQDITERKKAENSLLYTNYHDYLTGLYNRRFFEEKKALLDIEEMLPLSIIISDINGLKLINDGLGHAQGDNLIIETAKTLRSCCRKEDILARTGGDEFSILLPKTDTRTAVEIFKKIQTACSEYNKSLASETFHINISLGFGTKETADEKFEHVSKLAEDAMYQRKLLEHKSSHSAIISSIKATMIEKSTETETHAERLVFLSRIVGSELGLSELELDNLELYATLHDIGKVGISNHILKKPGALSQDEWVEMKKHSIIGYRIAMSTSELIPIAEYILSHHERWDGKGYPQGLSGFNIPLPSRILAIVDAYDAMTEDRIYRKAMTQEAAIAEIINNAGTQFDPEIARLFVEKALNKSGN